MQGDGGHNFAHIQAKFRSEKRRKVLTNFLPMCQKTAQICSIPISSVGQNAQVSVREVTGSRPDIAILGKRGRGGKEIF